MKTYVNKNPASALKSVAFSPSANGNYAFVTASDATGAAALKQWLEQPSVGQHVVAETQVDGKPLLVTTGGKNEQKLLEVLRERGDQLIPSQHAKKLDPWVIRSVLGIGGQVLQLTSSFMRPGSKGFRIADPSISVFAVANLAANAINLVYKAQTVDDPHRLRYLKEQVNTSVAPQLEAGNTVLPADDQRMLMRGDAPKKQVRHTLNDFMQRHSVNVGELGLRYLAAFGLAFPVDKWIPSAKAGKIPPMEPGMFRRVAGLGSIAGKTIALTSTIPDPYNPEAQSTFGRFRSDMSFKLGGAVEAAAFSVLAADCFFRTGPGKAQEKRGIVLNGKHQPDWLGGIGASMFVAGYLTRLLAKYGTRHVDMPELYAHTSDMLAQLPPGKLPQALADTTARLAEHFKDDPSMDYATIYTALTNDLCQYHSAALRGRGISATPGAQVEEGAVLGRLEAGKEPVSRLAV